MLYVQSITIVPMYLCSVMRPAKSLSVCVAFHFVFPLLATFSVIFFRITGKQRTLPETVRFLTCIQDMPDSNIEKDT